MDGKRQRDQPGGDGTTRVRAFAVGGRVRETGIALVHEGEYILPAAGAEAEVASVSATGPVQVSYTFPVRVVYAGGLSEEDRRSLEEGIWQQLIEAFERLE